MTGRKAAAKTNKSPHSRAARPKVPPKTPLAPGAAALQQSEERFRSVIAAMTEGVVLHRPDGTIIDCNPQAARILGLTRHQILGRTSRDPRWQAVREDGSPFPAEAHPAMVTLRTGQPCQQVVMGLRRPRGLFRWININAEPWFQNGASGAQGAVVTFTDITERKRTQEALALSHEQYRRAIIAANAIPYQKDYLADAYVFMAEGIKELTGYAPAELRSDLWKQIVLETDYLGEAAGLPAAEVLRRVLAGELKNWQTDHRIRTRSGEIRWITDASIPLRDAAGAYVGSIGIIQDITARKRAEAALRQANDALEQRVLERTAELNQSNVALRNEMTFSERIITTAQTIILILDADARIVRFNPYMEQLSGYRLKEVQGKNWFKVFLQKTDWQALRRIFLETLAGSPTHGTINAIRIRDGTLRTIEWNDMPLKDADGRITGLVAFGQDITERQQAEEALRKSEQRCRTIAAHTPDHILIQDLGLRYQLVINPQLGLTEAEMLGKTDRDLFNPADAARLTAVKKRILATGKPAHLELSLPNVRGEVEFFEGDYIPKLDATGKADGLIGYFRNVTDRRRAEEALRKSEERYRMLFTGSRDALMTLEPPGWRFTSGNPAAVEMFRAGDVHRLLATAPWELSPALQPDGRPSREAAQAVIETALRQGSQLFEWRHRRLDGEEFPALVLLTRVELEACAFLQATVRDITERVRLEQEILNISERERRRLAHDLHDGLGQLLVGASYLTNALRKDLAEKSAPEARRLKQIEALINEAITQSRNLARGVHPVEPEPNGLMVALGKLAEQTKKLFHIRCDFKCGRPVMIKDNQLATHLFRIAQEAVTNAIKHGRPKRIRIRLARAPDQISLAIQDDGAGIADQRPKKPGLGLTIMRYRAGIIGGTLTVQKESGGGTVVACRVTLFDGSNLIQGHSATGKPD